MRLFAILLALIPSDEGGCALNWNEKSQRWYVFRWLGTSYDPVRKCGIDRPESVGYIKDGQFHYSKRYLLVTYPPKASVAKLVNSLKGVSSRMIRRMGHESIQKQLWKGALWSPSYFSASCEGAPLSIIRQYIEQQNAPQ